MKHSCASQLPLWCAQRGRKVSGVSVQCPLAAVCIALYCARDKHKLSRWRMEAPIEADQDTCPCLRMCSDCSATLCTYTCNAAHAMHCKRVSERYGPARYTWTPFGRAVVSAVCVPTVYLSRYSL